MINNYSLRIACALFCVIVASNVVAAQRDLRGFEAIEPGTGDFFCVPSAIKRQLLKECQDKCATINVGLNKQEYHKRMLASLRERCQAVCFNKESSKWLLANDHELKTIIQSKKSEDEVH